MKTIKIALFSLMFTCGMTSCDFLEKEPYKIVPENYFKDVNEAQKFLTGIYANLAQGSFYGNNYLTIAGGDDLTYYGGGTKRITSGLICNNATTSNAPITAFWANLYNGIEHANMFLEQLDNVPGIKDEERNRYRAEARFLRAFYYFNLVQNFGDVPFKLESTYSTGSVENKDIARTDKHEIYAFIVKEMSEVAQEADESKGLQDGGLPTAASLSYLPGRVSKSAAWGILARVYLFWAGEHNRDGLPLTDADKERFRLASEYGQKVISSGHKLADKYWDPFIDMCADQYNTTAKESIWEVEFAGDGTGDIRAEGRIGNINGLPGPDWSSYSDVTGIADPGYAYGFLHSTPKLYDIYKENGDMERFVWNIAPFGYRGAGKDANNKPIVQGVVGRTFENKELYDYVTGPEGYQERSFDYTGANDGQEYNSKNKNDDLRGDMYKEAAMTDGDKLSKTPATGKFRREYEPVAKKNKNNTSINFPILRYSDVLLMVAEAENEYNGGPTELARNLLNEVRRRAGVSENADEHTSQISFREAIKNERAMELCFEYLRRYDLIRWGDFVKNMQEIYTMALDGAYWGEAEQAAPFFNVTDAYLYCPIPEAEKAVNKLIVGNNPGW